MSELTKFEPCTYLSNHAPNSIVTSLDFSDSGQWLISAGNDESIQLYDCRTATHTSSLYSKKYGCTLARFTHSSTNCIYASTKEDDSIRYLSLHDNQFIRYFRGHKNVVNSLEVSPTNDMFISSALDRTVRIWDLKSPNCQGIIKVPTPSLVAFDSMSLVFAVASQEAKTVALYDVRNFDKAPFKTFSAHHVEGNWQKVEFSNDSSHIVVASDGPAHGLFNGLDGSAKGLCTGHQPIKRPTSSPVAFTMDGKYLLAGGEDHVTYWDISKASNGTEETIHKPVIETPGPKSSLVSFNPRTMLMASADEGVNLWIPREGD